VSRSTSSSTGGPSPPSPKMVSEERMISPTPWNQVACNSEFLLKYKAAFTEQSHPVRTCTQRHKCIHEHATQARLRTCTFTYACMRTHGT
jgi:hypothetical protein